MGKTLLSREALLAKEKLEIVRVDLGNDEYVFVRQMTGRERDAFEASLIEVQESAIPGGKPIVSQRTEDFRAKLAVHTVCDESGELLLEAGDYETLSTNISARRLEAIVNVAEGLNRISATDRDNLLKN